jgi:hypothetical protein
MRKMAGKKIITSLLIIMLVQAVLMIFCNKNSTSTGTNPPVLDSKIFFDSAGYSGMSSKVTVTLIEPDHKTTTAVVKICSQSDTQGILLALSTAGPKDTLGASFGFSSKASSPGEKIKVGNHDVVTVCYLDTGEGTCTASSAWNAILTDLKVADEIAGWKSGKYTEFTPWTLWDLINGGDDKYTAESTLVKGFIQFLDDTVNGANTSIGLRIMDYGTAANAAAMYHKIKPPSLPDSLDYFKTNPFAVPPFDTSILIARPTGGGVEAYAHFDRFYFQLSNSGYALTDEAVADIKLFIVYFQSIAQ